MNYVNIDKLTACTTTGRDMRKKLAWYEYVLAVLWTVWAICHYGVDGAHRKVLAMYQEALGKVYGGKP